MYQKSQLYDVRFLRYGVTQTEFFVILGHFLPFNPLMDPENQNFEKMKKKKQKQTPKDIILLQMCTINDNHMMHGSWNMECNGQRFLSLWTTFCLYPSNNPKKKFLKKMEKLPADTGDIIILHRCNINGNHIMYASQDTEHIRQNFLLFWMIFYTFTP